MRLPSGIGRKLFLLAMFAGAAVITAMSLVYFDSEELPPFVIERLPVVKFPSLWLLALKVHVTTALVSLPLCLFLMMRWVQRRPQLHRWLGRFTGTWVMVGLVPSGAVLAFNAKGGPGVSAGFLFSGAIIACAMVYGVLAARRRDLAAHAHAMRHVVAQMSVAVFSRTMIVGFDMIEFDPDVAYVISLWVPVLLTAALAEAVSRRFPFSVLNPFHALQRSYNVPKPLAAVVRARSYAHSLDRGR